MYTCFLFDPGVLLGNEYKTKARLFQPCFTHSTQFTVLYSTIILYCGVGLSGQK